MNLKQIRDDRIIEEAIQRLLQRAKDKAGSLMEYGTLTIKIHEGICSYVEYNLKGRCFKANKFRTIIGGKNG